MRPLSLSLAVFSLPAFAVAFLSPATAGDLYKWTDDKGQVHYSSVPPVVNPSQAKAVDPKSLPRLNTLPSNPSAGSAEDGSAQTSNRSGTSKPAATPPVADSSSPAEPASPPALIPASLLPPSNPPSTAKPEQPAQPDLVEVVAQGMGTDANAALLNAYSNAVQQALGSYVDAETLVQNDQIVRDKILTYSKGFIEKADIVSQNQANGLFQVNIRAKVKRQQLLEQAKTNNISVKAVEGVSLHAQVESQIKQETDAKALLEKALLPLMGTTFHRAELVPATQEQPNPTINKAGTDNNFVTLDYKVYMWIDEQEYLNYIKNSLIPVLSQVAIRKGDLTAKYTSGNFSHDPIVGEDRVLDNKEQQESSNETKAILFNILIWKDKGLSSSKWQWFTVSKDTIPPKFYSDDFDEKNNLRAALCGKEIELSLLDEKGEPIAFGNAAVNSARDSLNRKCRLPSTDNDSTSPIAIYGKIIRISPYFTLDWFSHKLGRSIRPPKSNYFTVGVKISKEDLPRVKNAKLEVKSAGE